MKRRALLSLPIVALGGFEPARAAAADSAQSRRDLASTPVELFRFHAGASLLAPAGAGPDGTICVGTADGYVHLLGPDGSFRWSHGVHGAVTRRPICIGALWLVATSAERIYALTPEGTLYWVFKPPSAVGSELAADATHLTYFVGVDQFLYGVSVHGGVSLRVAFGVPKSGPSTAPDGAVWAENQLGQLVRVRGQEVRRVPSQPSPQFDFGSEEVVRDPEGHEWRARADGVLEFRHAANAEPTLVELTQASLLSPCWSTSAHYALISARDGLLVAFGTLRPPEGN